MSARLWQKKGWLKPSAWYRSQKLEHPLPVLGQAVVVEHEAGKVIALAQLLSSAMMLAGLRLRTLRPKMQALGRLAEVAVVLAAPPGDDGQERGRQVGDKGHLGRVEGVAVFAPLVEEEVAVGKGQRLEVRRLALKTRPWAAALPAARPAARER
jgi:hypothetical protein